MTHSMAPDDTLGWVAAYAAQGRHRTGTPTDATSAAWLAVVAADLGARVSRESFAFSRLASAHGVLTVDGGRVLGLPLFDGTLTDGVTGTLGELGSSADIGVVEVRPAGPADQLDAARVAATHLAIVAVTLGGRAGLAPRNATTAAPWGPPVLQVSSRHRRRLVDAARHGVTATLRVEGTRRPGRADNVLARQDPRRTSRLVVLTPRSGWWSCAAERGGGIAGWLAALAGATGRGVRFVATSGHELGSLGLHAHLGGDRPPPVDATWVHLGANIGARGGQVRWCASDPELSAVVAAAFAAPDAPAATPAAEPVGEARELARRGHRFVSIFGTNTRFHLPSDGYPDNVDSEMVCGAARTVARLVVTLDDVLEPRG